MMTIGALIEGYIGKHQMTLEEFSEYSEIPAVYVKKFIDEKPYTPSTKTIHSLAKALGMPASTLAMMSIMNQEEILARMMQR